MHYHFKEPVVHDVLRDVTDMFPDYFVNYHLDYNPVCSLYKLQVDLISRESTTHNRTCVTHWTDLEKVNLDTLVNEILNTY